MVSSNIPMNCRSTFSLLAAKIASTETKCACFIITHKRSTPLGMQDATMSIAKHCNFYNTNQVFKKGQQSVESYPTRQCCCFSAHRRLALIYFSNILINKSTNSEVNSDELTIGRAGCKAWRMG